MNKIKYIFLFCLLSQIEVIYSQSSCVIAGDTTLTHYTDLIPDTIIDNIYPQYYELDLNQDNHSDFRIIYQQVFTSFAFYGFAEISALDSNKILMNGGMPDTLNNTDTICPSSLWGNTANFYSYHYFPLPSYDIHPWDNLSAKYVGLKLITTNDTTFGWVQIYVHKPNYVTIKNFGCGDIDPYTVPIVPIVPLPISSETIIYPNPTFDIITIHLPSYSSYETMLYNSLGEIVYQNSNAPKTIDMEIYPIGIYVLEIKTSDKIFRKKVVRIRRPR